MKEYIDILHSFLLPLYYKYLFKLTLKSLCSDMVMYTKPDWKCVFCYVQSIHRRFRNED